MAIKCLTLSDVRTVECDLDPDKGTENATKFKIGTLDSRIMGKLKDQSTSLGFGAANFSGNGVDPDADVDIQVDQNEMYFKACQFGLRGWSNLPDNDGNDLPFETYTRNVGGRNYPAVKDEILGRVPQAVIANIGAKIIAANEVSEGEAKN